MESQLDTKETRSDGNSEPAEGVSHHNRLRRLHHPVRGGHRRNRGGDGVRAGLPRDVPAGTQAQFVKNDVKERRGARELSQGELAAALGVSRQTINSIEKGRYLPSLPLALALARYFETTVEEMFDDEAD